MVDRERLTKELSGAFLAGVAAAYFVPSFSILWPMEGTPFGAAWSFAEVRSGLIQSGVIALVYVFLTVAVLADKVRAGREMAIAYAIVIVSVPLIGLSVRNASIFGLGEWKSAAELHLARGLIILIALCVSVWYLRIARGHSNHSLQGRRP